MDNRRRMMWKKPPEYAIYYTSTDGSIVQTSSSGWDARLVSNTYENGIGKIVFNKPVTKIPSNAFSYKSTLSSLHMPDTITEISSNCFENCVNLTEVTFSSQLTILPSGSFANCGFTSIVIPDNIVEIKYAFTNCANLTNVVLGRNVTSISAAFRGTSLEKIILPPSVSDISQAFPSTLKQIYISDITQWLKFSFYSSLNHPGYENSNLEIYVNNVLLTELIVPDDITTINSSAFYNYKYLQKIHVGDSVTSIGMNAFYANTLLEEIYLGNNVVLSNHPFKLCTGLKKINIKSLENWCKTTGFTYSDYPTKYTNNLWINDVPITEVNLDISCNTINDYTLANCAGITKVTINNNIKNVGAGAFSGDSNISEVYCDSMQTWCSIPWSAAEGSTPAYYGHALIYINGEIIQDVVIPSNITTLSGYIFKGWNSMKSIFLHENITNISAVAFEYTSPEVHVPTLEAWFKINFGNGNVGNSLSAYMSGLYVDGELQTNIIVPTEITEIMPGTLYEYKKLESITIHDGITSIGYRAFCDCNSLRSVTIGNGITSIGKEAFWGCTSLISVYITDIAAWCNISFGNNTSNPLTYTKNLYLNNELVTDLIIPDSITSIGSYAFYGCDSFTSVTIGNGVTSIGKEAFRGSGALTSVTIGNSVTSIGSNAFYSCTSLKNIHSLNHIAPTITSNSFYGVARNGVLVYPTNSDYSSWMQTSASYLGYYNWTSQWPYTPQTYYDLSITAQDVIGNSPTTTISWTCMSDGVDYVTGETITGIQLSGTAISEEFPQNTSETETVERIITFEYQGLTASTTITQGVWINQSYELVLNDNWQLSTAVASPDSTVYDGVYESFSNYNKNSTAAIMYIDISGYETFQLYIRSYAESNYDYVMVSQIDQTIDNNSSYSNTTLVKAHTRGTQKSGTTISDYTLVEFTGLDTGAHRITVVYRKDSSGNSGTDKGYLIIPRQ